MKIAEIWSGDDHPVQDRLDLVVGLLADRLDLLLAAVAAGLFDQERPQGSNVALAQHRAQALNVLAVTRRHRWRSADQVGGGPGDIGADQDSGGAVSSDESVRRSPPPMLPTRL